MHDYWPAFQKLEKENQKRQSAVLNAIREGKSLALTFAASKETFPKTPQNFRCALCARSLKSAVVTCTREPGRERMRPILNPRQNSQLLRTIAFITHHRIECLSGRSLPMPYRHRAARSPSQADETGWKKPRRTLPRHSADVSRRRSGRRFQIVVIVRQLFDLSLIVSIG
jgi:hypothetical protein